MIQSWSTCT